MKFEADFCKLDLYRVALIPKPSMSRVHNDLSNSVGQSIFGMMGKSNNRVESS